MIDKILSVFGKKHLSFKGIEMNCSVTDFAEKLVSQGFIKSEHTSKSCMLEGMFAGEYATVVLVGNDEDYSIMTVYVEYSESSSWYELKKKYLLFKKSLQDKYGKGNSYEFFNEGYTEGDGFELKALKSGDCSCATIFKTGLGDVSVSMTPECKVALLYSDKISHAIQSQYEANQRNSDL